MDPDIVVARSYPGFCCSHNVYGPRLVGKSKCMGLAYPVISDRRSIRVLDLVVVVWVVAWAVLALVVALEFRTLRQVGTTLVRSADVLTETADVLESVEDVPVIGERAGSVAEPVENAADSARVSGLSSRESVKDLSILLGIVIFLIPTIPIVSLYAPLRIAWKREVQAMSNALVSSKKDPMFKEFLARRAAQRLDFHVLADLGINPWRALDEGRYDELAEAELKRLGLSTDNT